VSTVDGHPPIRQHYNLTLLVLATSALAYALAQTMVAPALPDIQRSLHTSTTSVTWVLTVYLLTASVATPIVGRLGDMFGKERMLLVTLGFFGLGSLVAALSHSIAILVAGRAIQGVGGAVFPLAFGIIRDEFPPEKVATAIGLISATFGIGGGAGLVLSGVIVDHLAYEWIFWLALAVVMLAIVATHLFVPESPVKSPAKIDWTGAGLLSAGLVCLLFGLSEASRWGWGSAQEIGMLAAATLILLAWGRFELRVPDPLVDMRMMRRRPVLTTNLTALLIGFGMFGSFIIIPQLVQLPKSTGFGFAASVTEAGLFLLPSTAVMLFAGPIAGVLGARLGSKLPLIAGTLFASLSFAFLSIRARATLGHLLCDSPDGPGNRLRVRLDGQPDRRGGRPARDRRRNRDEHDHAHDRRLARRPSLGHDPRRAHVRGASEHHRLHDRLRGLRRGRADRVRIGACNPRSSPAGRRQRARFRAPLASTPQQNTTG
jgi:EmrB/QacA subfamily drug resistance transporter